MGASGAAFTISRDGRREKRGQTPFPPRGPVRKRPVLHAEKLSVPFFPAPVNAAFRKCVSGSCERFVANRGVVGGNPEMRSRNRVGGLTTAAKAFGEPSRSRDRDVFRYP